MIVHARRGVRPARAARGLRRRVLRSLLPAYAPDALRVGVGVLVQVLDEALPGGPLRPAGRRRRDGGGDGAMPGRPVTTGPGGAAPGPRVGMAPSARTRRSTSRPPASTMRSDTIVSFGVVPVDGGRHPHAWRRPPAGPAPRAPVAALPDDPRAPPAGPRGIARASTRPAPRSGPPSTGRFLLVWFADVEVSFLAGHLRGRQRAVATSHDRRARAGDGGGRPAPRP